MVCNDIQLQSSSANNTKFLRDVIFFPLISYTIVRCIVREAMLISIRHRSDEHDWTNERWIGINQSNLHPNSKQRELIAVGDDDDDVFPTKTIIYENKLIAKGGNNDVAGTYAFTNCY